jgi:filamentous hemagglutinin family protein
MAGSVLPRLFNLDFSASGGTANRKWHNKTSARNSLVRKARRYLTVTGLLSAMILVPNMRADAAPQGGTVVAGTANIVSAPSTVTVKQSSQDSIINWQSFSVGKTESVIFQQPNASSVTLNRVVGGEPSLILGRLSANGQVFLINPNGALFAKGAQVNVGGLVVSTLDITNSDFMAGRYNFAGSSENGVVNEGSITAGDGGYVALLGAKVDNEGVITAKLGTVALAAGAGMTLDVAGNG